MPGRFRSRRPILILTGAILAAGAAIAALPGVATWQITTQLEQLGAKSVAMDKVSINPMTGEISVTGFKSVGPDGEDITVGRAYLRISLSALARRQITVQQLSVADADIDLRLDQRGRWSVGGFPMDFASDPTPTEEPDDPWDLKANNIGVDNSRITLSLQGATRVAMVKTLRLDALSTLRPDDPASMELDLEAGGSTARMTGKIYPFAKGPRATITAKIDSLNLETLDPLLKAGRIRKLAGKAAVDGTLSLSFGAGGDMDLVYEGSTRVTAARANTTHFRVAAAQLEWDGTAKAVFPSNSAATSLPDVDLKGRTTLDGFSYRNTVTGLELDGKRAALVLEGPGLKVSTAAAPGASTKIDGKADFHLSDANLKQRDTGLTLQPKSMRIVSSFTVELPPATAAFTAMTTSTVTMKGFRGSVKSAERQSISAASLRLHYRDAKIGIGAKGGIETEGRIDLTLDNLAIDATDTASVTVGKIAMTGQKFRFGRTATGDLKAQSTGPLNMDNIQTADADKTWNIRQRSSEWLGSFDIALKPDGTSSWSTDGSLTNRGIAIALPRAGLTVDIGKSRWTGKASGSAEPDELKAFGETAISDIRVTTEGASPYTARLKNVDMKGISVSDAVRNAATITFSGIEAGNKSAQDIRPRIALPRLLLTDAKLHQSGRIELGEIRATGLTAGLTRGPDGTIAMPSLQPAGTVEDKASGLATKASKTATPSEHSSGEDGTIRMGRAIITDARVEFADTASSPPFQIETSRFQASISDFDTAMPDSDTAFDVLVGLGKFGRVQIVGSMKPRFDDITANAAISFKSIELFKFNGYIQPAIQHRIQQGRADGTVELKITADKLDAKSKLSISRLKVKATPTEKDGSGPPIETALDLLKDDKGNIELSIPVTGSIGDPQFDLSDAIGQAVAGAMKETVLTAVKIAFPLGAVFAIVDAAGVPKIRIKPVAFPPGSALLTSSINARIAEAAAYLKRKPGEKPSICGPATAADLAILVKSNAKAGKAEAIGLATARVNGVRDRLVSKHSISPSRLFVCEPEFSEKPDETPSVRIDLKG
ncbi:MAG: DUF748 domain-containing protein [Alphaproteobacteria bacterium]